MEEANGQSGASWHRRTAGGWLSRDGNVHDAVKTMEFAAELMRHQQECLIYTRNAIRQGIPGRADALEIAEGIKRIGPLL